VIRRRLFTIAGTVSLLLCVTTVALWMLEAVGPRFGSAIYIFGVGMGGREYELKPNSPFWLVVIPLAVPPIVVARRMMRHYRERVRSEAGLCAKCSYVLTANTSGVCPECGTAVPAATGEKPPA
jgi:hypothetical protein